MINFYCLQSSEKPHDDKDDSPEVTSPEEITEKNKQPKKPINRRGARGKPKSKKPPAQKRTTTPDTKPELLCRETQNREQWQIFLSNLADNKSTVRQGEAELSVNQNDEYLLSNFTETIHWAADGKDEKIELFGGGQPLIFKLRKNWTGNGRRISAAVITWFSHREIGKETDVRKFCQSNSALEKSLRDIVPPDMHKRIGLHNGTWVDKITGEGSRFDDAEKEVCQDYCRMQEKREDCRQEDDDLGALQIGSRIKTIAEEKTLNFLSRKAIIPKYGFPVDVVELDTRPNGAFGVPKVSLQRDLSQAIAEYAPGAKVVANKTEWESYGVRVVRGKSLIVKQCYYNQARDFKQWSVDDDQTDGIRPTGSYLVLQFGFVTELLKVPKEPKKRAHRLYTTRPFFQGFDGATNKQQVQDNSFGIKITPALPGRMVVLCEGKSRGKFYICRQCGTGSTERSLRHKSPEGYPCNGTLEHLALGHEFVTDVVRLQFPNLVDHRDAYSLAYAILLGVAQTLNVPDTDLNATITAGENAAETAIVLYDNVPGGAGLVASLEDPRLLKTAIAEAAKRVDGECGCSESCYGCIRSYRNQFVHPYLRRTTALQFLTDALENAAVESK